MGRWLLLGSVLLAVSCTDSNFFVPPVIMEHPIDNKVSVSGGFCAEGADGLESFLKIMFIIDRSNSMRVTDPNNRRVTAVADVINQFIDDPLTLDLQTGVEFALVSFWGDVAVHTRNEMGLPGFSTDGPQILASLVRIAETSSNTGYDKALSTAFQVLDTDMARLPDVARERSRYEIFFLSDGMPFPDNCTDESNSLRTAVRSAARIKALEALHGVSVTFHTGFASDPDMFTLILDDDEACCLGVDISPINLVQDCEDDPVSAGAVTRKLLREMAAEGDGTFKQFENGDAINFLDFDFAESRRLYALSYFITTNINAVSDYDHVDPDSDGDGLTDAEEVNLGTSPYYADSDGDGFADGIEERFRLTGLDPLDPTDAQCNDLDRVDVDDDGLLDCEERFLGTLRKSYDTDADGIPDWIEIISNADANSASSLQDHQTDSDADGGTNAEELRWHTNPKRDDVGKRAEIAYDYFQTELPITTGQACYEFRVDNISLASTIGSPADRSKGFCVPPGSDSCSVGTPCAGGMACDERHGVCHAPNAAWCYDTSDCTGGLVCGNATQQDGWNRIMLYMAQTPYDEPLSEPVYRVACVEARFIEERDLKIPANGIIHLPEKRPSDTYHPNPVLRPNQTPCHVSNNQDCGLDTIWCIFDDNGVCTECYDPPVAAGDPLDGFLRPGGCPTCADGIDNDNDGKTDFPFDPDCFDSLADNEAPDDQCSDGIDNDGDGKTDWPNDPGCGDAVNDGDETDPSPLPECADGLDNDNNGVIDFPLDPGCYAASDATEALSISNPVRACADGVDNDGDGLVDLGDPGCFDPEDIDEDGPAVCFYCEKVSDILPGQCDIGAGYCRARAGFLPGNQNCTSHDQCRGGICDQTAGSPTFHQCVRCLEDTDCDVVTGPGTGICDASQGWCLRSYLPDQITECHSDVDCPHGPCETDLGYCAIDPYHACRTDQDCRPEEICSKERGFCLKRAFQTQQCRHDLPCSAGQCDEDAGWCLPTRTEDQCRGDDECPFGECGDNGACDQQTFTFPKDFRPEVDCIRAD